MATLTTPVLDGNADAADYSEVSPLRVGMQQAGSTTSNGGTTTIGRTESFKKDDVASKHHLPGGDGSNSSAVNMPSPDGSTPASSGSGTATGGSGAAGGQQIIPRFGNSKLCCWNRCFLAYDWTATLVIMTIVLMFNASMTWVFFHHLDMIWVLIVNYCFSALLMTSMWLATTTDPGVMPKRPPMDPNSPNYKAPPPDGYSEYIVLQGVQVLTPYCHTCRITRPPRCSHCHSCNNCVDKFDHHCGIIGACVGRYNYKYFFAFLMGCVLTALWTAIWSGWYLGTYWNGSDNIVKKGLGVVNVIVGAMVFLQIGAMLVHYVKLTTKGYTQREWVKKDRLYGVGTKNPYDNGCKDNYYEACCL